MRFSFIPSLSLCVRVAFDLDTDTVSVPHYFRSCRAGLAILFTPSTILTNNATCTDATAHKPTRRACYVGTRS